jgi:hypothetical protein
MLPRTAQQLEERFEAPLPEESNNPASSMVGG